MTTNEELEKARERIIEAIAGGTITVQGGYGNLERDDAENIADAAIDAIGLADRLAVRITSPDAATSAIERVRAIHFPLPNSTSALPPKPECNCGSGNYDECPTIAALDGAPESEEECADHPAPCDHEPAHERQAGPWEPRLGERIDQPSPERNPDHEEHEADDRPRFASGGVSRGIHLSSVPEGGDD